MPPPKRACQVCNDLDPRNHLSTRYNDDPQAGASVHRKRKRGAAGTTPADTQACILTLPINSRDLLRRSDQCRFCAVLVRALDAVFESWRGQKSLKQTNVKTMELELRWQGTIKLLLGGGEDAEEMVEIYGGRDRDLPWPALGSSYDIPYDPSSDKTYDFIRLCLARCEEKHKRACVKWKYGDERPSRLLELQDDMVTVKLIDGSDGRYIALSHCWGSSFNPPLTTTVDTAAARMNGTHLDDLPAMYRDAVEIAKTLDVRLLWIDSLCIIQDSPKDWELESAKMASIYSGAYLTIAATAANNSSDGILAMRRVGKKVKYQNTKGDEHRLRVRLAQNQHLPGHHFRPLGPLMSRGWTLQESLLSSRVLHYTSTEVLFECREYSACECRPTFISSSSLAAFQADSELPAIDFLHCWLWRNLVENYSARSITKETDKLTALSGIACAMSPVGAKYLAGLWTKGLPYDLIWSTAPWLSHPHRFSLPADYRAPSWSWASIDAPVRWENPKKDHHSPLIHKVKAAKVTGFDEESLKQNPYGVMSGYVKLEMKGFVQEATLIAPHDYEFYYLLKFAGGRGSLNVFPDCLLTAKLDDTGAIIGAERARAGKSKYQPFKAPVTCLAIHCDDETDAVTGLVLSRESGSQSTFVRLGLFSCGRQAFKGEQQHLTIL